MSWIARETHTTLETKYMDVYPDGEAMFHLLGRREPLCGCGPKVTSFQNGAEMATHNAWDEREELEESVGWV